MAWNPDDYYPKRPGGPYIPGSPPRVGRSNNIQDYYMTEKTIEDRVRNIPEFQGANEQQMWGYIQNEIDKWRADAIGLQVHKGDARRNTSADTGPD